MENANMSLDHDTLELIQSTAVKASGDDIVKVSYEPSHVYFIRNRTTGELAKHEAAPAIRGYHLSTIDDVVEAVKAFATKVPKADPVVFCGRGKITAILDEGTGRRERLVMDLPMSGEFEKLKELERRSPMAQKQFVSTLRISLAGSVDPAVVSTFRDLKFSRSEDGESAQTNSKETVGRKVRMELAGGGKPIPDEIDVTPFVYRDLVDEPLRQKVRCAIDVNLDDSTFTLVPLAGELERAQRQTDLWIKSHLIAALESETSPISVFCGNA